MAATDGALETSGTDAGTVQASTLDTAAAQGDIKDNKDDKDDRNDEQLRKLLVAAVAVVAAVLIAGIVCFFIVQGLRNASRSGNPTPELIFTYLIWRHGDRAPNRDFPFRTKQEQKKMWPRGLGNLTEIGLEQMRALGRSIKERYVDGPPFVEKNEFYLRSTKKRRTIESAQNFLKGMGWEDVTINTPVSMDNDHEGNPLFKCEKARLLEKERGNDCVYKDKFPELYKTIVQEVNLTGEAYATLDILRCMQDNHHKWPEWVTNDLLRQMKHTTATCLESKFGRPDRNDKTLLKIRCGSILRGVVKNLEIKINCEKEGSREGICRRKLYGLSAHDITVAGSLVNFENYKRILGEHIHADYGSNVAYELWKIDGSYFLKVEYANIFNVTTKTVTEYVDGCLEFSKYCPVDKVLPIWKKMYFEDVISACNEPLERAERIYFGYDLNKYFDGDLSVFLDEFVRETTE